MKRLVALLLALAVVAAMTPVVRAYLLLGFEIGNRLVAVRWTQFPIQYFITNRDVEAVSAAQLQAAIGRAFGTWGAPDGVSLAGAFAGFTGAEPFDDDGMNVIGFQFRPELDRTLGAATFTFDTVTGRLVESDIFFNSAFPWSVSANGEADRYDVESIGLHELGHLLGLGHSALGETEMRPEGGRRILGKRAVMFPIAYPAGNILDRQLKADDETGITESYATGPPTLRLGSLAGRVTLNGDGLFGAHVVAYHSRTGELVSGFSLGDDGEFVIASLAPGLYIVRVEPIDDADVTSFFDEDADVNIDFRAKYYERLVGVPSGGSSQSIEIRVQPK